MSHGDHSVSMSFSSSHKFTEMAIMVLNHLKSNFSIDDDEFFKVEISLREAITNAIVHGNRLDPAKRVKVDVSWKADRLRILVADENRDVTDFSSIQEDLNSCELLSFSGRGITIMRSYMDSCDFECTGTGNRVVMEKQFK